MSAETVAWVASIYSVLVTIVAMTPTKADDDILDRLRNVVVELGKIMVTK